LGAVAKPDTTDFRRPAPREAVSSEVAQIVIDYLLSGRIHPGERLPSERDLGAALSVGRSAIREALSALKLLGVLEVRQGGGHYLRGVTSELLPKVIHWGLLIGEKQPLELLEARAALEVRAAYLAAQRHDSETIKTLRKHFDHIKDHASKGGAELADDDLAFHETLVRTSDNAVLLEVWFSLRALLRVWIIRVIEQQRSPRNFLQEHRAILRAIEAGDPAAAAAAMHTHMDRATDRLRAVIESGAEATG
jgi:GntR family transcriptional repressor for pyruvate dehydrogenase complex